ncbi:MAG: RES family NAD+ phosphorylase [Proteobacteria bacterium]|nr:RES family NAD+ phosphorylase [Pseudomonadota bacterium]
MRDILDAQLLDALDAIQGEIFEGEVWRATWATRDPLAGSSAGGRWSPDNSFDALYTSLERDGALAEIYYHLSRAPVFSSSHTYINKIAVSLSSVLRSSVEQIQKIGVADPLATRIDYLKSQPIGAAAYLLEFDGLIVPSARWDCNNLILFPEKMSNDEQLKLVEANDVNWPAWREATGVR